MARLPGVDVLILECHTIVQSRCYYSFTSRKDTSGEMLVNIGGSGHCVKTVPQEGIQADARTTIGISGIV